MRVRRIVPVVALHVPVFTGEDAPLSLGRRTFSSASVADQLRRTYYFASNLDSISRVVGNHPIDPEAVVASAPAMFARVTAAETSSPTAK